MGYKISEKEKNLMKTEDIHVTDFANMLWLLPSSTPLSLAYDKEYGQKTGVWWTSQREHLITWFLSQKYDTRGRSDFYNHASNKSSRLAYNHYNRPEGLLWLAEALGVDERIVHSAILKLNEDNRPQTNSKLVRETIPFELVLKKINELNVLTSDESIL